MALPRLIKIQSMQCRLERLELRSIRVGSPYLNEVPTYLIYPEAVEMGFGPKSPLGQ